jgi:thimet oligopeptidase
MKKTAFLVSILATSSAFAQLPNFTLTDQEVTKACKDAIAKAGTAIDAIAKNTNPPTFENTVAASETALSEFDASLGVPTMLAYIATSATVRQASTDCEVLVKKFVIDTFSRSDLYTRFQTVRNSDKGRKLQGEDKKLVDDYYTAFIQNGVDVADKDKRQKVMDLSKEISEKETEFSKNIRDDQRFIQLDKSDLAGLPPDWIASLKKADNGKYIVTTNYPDYFPFMKNAKSQNARKRLYEQFNVRGGKRNVEILEKTLQLRSELAQLMGFASHADKVLALDGRMATSVGQVRTFIDDLVVQLNPYLDKDLGDLRKLKCKETKCKDWDDVVLNPWDVAYYLNQLERNVGNLDPEAVKAYFPLETVTRGMFQIYQTLLGLTFEKLQNVNVWDPSVEVYAVRDNASKEVLGTFYLDMYPREGKYGHAAVAGLIKPKYLEEGQYQKALAIMMCNFPKPTAEMPSLLRHGEVETYFHEFGHVMADIVARTRYYSHGGGTVYNERGTGLSRDFVEAPSQMLENWVWNPESLAMLSGHYKTNEKLPKSMLDQMLALKNVANGYVNTRQLMMASIDLDYHTAKQPVDSTAIWNERSKSMVKINPLKGVYSQASFGHIMGGYDVGYYGYMWSRVYAEDMFSVFEKAGILNPRTGMSYRKQILEPAGARAASESLQKFLGRAPSTEAFLKSLGIAPKAKEEGKAVSKDSAGEAAKK